MPEIVLEAHNLSKKFKRGEVHRSLRDFIPALARRAVQGGLSKEEFWALRDVSFEIEQGEAFAIIGHNGAGKSTMLKHLCGILMPTSGRLSVKGRLSALIEVGAGFHHDLTGRENIYLNGTILGMTRQEIDKKFDAIVAFSELEEFLDTPVKRYSSGMYARLGFAVAVHVDPDILIVDEVLSVGDFLFQRKSVEKMRQVMKAGTTVVFVSHNLRAVADLCPRAMLLEHGTVGAIGPSGAVIKAYMERGSAAAQADETKDAYIAGVTLRDPMGVEAVQFQSKGKMLVQVEIVARRHTDKLAIVIECKDEELYEVFNTSSQRLGSPAFTLEAGERFRATFELTVHLAPGTYHIGVYLYRYDVQREFDQRVPAATFYVRSDVDVRGIVDLEPRVIEHQKVP